MKKGEKKLLSALSVTLVIVMALMGCSGSGGNTASPKSDSPSSQNNETPSTGDAFVLGEKPLEFSFYGHYDWYTMPDWGADLATKWIQENKKVNVVPVSSGGVAKNKLSTMIVSGELPDVIWMEPGAEVEKLRSEGMLVPFDDYLDKYPNLKKWAGESTLELLRSPDGKLYQFPNWYTTQPNGNAGYLVNKKIYEELGSPSLETPDDLYAYLKQVKAKYPDVVPLEVGQAAAGVDIMVSAFAENRPYTFNSMIAVPQGDQLVSLFTDPVYRELLQYMGRLYREKLVTQDAFTQKLEQVEQKILNGKVAVYVASSPTEFGSKGNNLLKAQDPDAGYIMVWPVHKAELDRNKIYPGDYKQLGWNVSVITKAAKDPEAIFAFLDWFTGPEGQRTIMWGPEGLYWDGTDEEDMPLFTDKFTSDAKGRDELMNATVNFQWSGNTVYVDNSKMKFESTLPPEKRNFETYWQSEITWKTQMNTTEYVNLDPAGDSEEGIIAQRVFEIYEQARAKAISSTSSDQEVLSLLDKAEADAQKAGYDKLLKYKTAKWQENKEKMAVSK
ncbi:extracellular solute-binding protein [Paenibacillus glucanolyticus]|uniref:ABC transporter substrate-binding protein n=1 Tax=Paenibacillus glucanolyticus TaxID=59843 RepID=A0A163G3G1_9BACL|nr:MULTISPECIES: extracellular solute-binding protein [Paenibacillus]KZS44712.1 ABC transporter substrate-binding protein [Paenibacillus glucanolyticus]MDH6670311.1 putative aldouronate transport system substrate-binding protein [Paenibacillus sp. LBL]OMF64163.1 ABC transporter substrate-binding protein [Paenibacillus glucanolyticus]